MKLLVLFLTMAITEGQVNLTPAVAELHNLIELNDQDNKKEISAQELPEAVMTAYQESDYSEWSIDKVYMLEGSQETTFELHLFQDEETVILIADTEGNLQPKTDS